MFENPKNIIGLKIQGKIKKLMGKEDRVAILLENAQFITKENTWKEFTDWDGKLKKGEMWIRSWTDYGYIYIEIKGSGEGIHNEDMEKFYDPLLATKGDNSRLNLDLCYRIIKEHNGEIEVENKVGKGTKFTIKLPM